MIFLNKCPLQIFNTVLHPILIHMKTAFPSGYHSDVSALEKTGSPSHISSESSSCMLFFSFPGHPSVHFRNHDILYSNSNFKGGNNHAQESSSNSVSVFFRDTAGAPDAATGAPVNEVDACCMRHDLCLQKGYHSCYCDRQFMKCLDHYRTPMTPSGRHANLMYQFMKVKTSLTCGPNR